MHLLQQCQHADKCTDRQCAGTCGYRLYDQWLSAPLLPADQTRLERIEQRRAALLRGEIPV